MIVAKKENNPVFSLVMPCYKCEDTIKKAIDSILDQDEEGFEVVAVVNGEWENRKKAEKTLKGYAKKDKRIRFICLEGEGNACTARNEGAKLAKGRYISFFSSDFYMYPGALRKWKKTFEEHLDADFIYSGYGLMDHGKQIGNTFGEPFDPWRLRIENYIDGGFPMKREVWEAGAWDPAIKSLNDWDFWLTAIDNGFKGYLMPDQTYAAEMPRPGGLSYDSHANWLERVSQIKKKHKIKESDICVVSLGAAPHGKKLAKILGADFKYAPQIKPHKYKMIYLIGFYVGTGDSAVHHTEVFKNAGTAIPAIHWIGTDVLQMVGASSKVCYRDFKPLVDTLDKCVNFTEFEDTQGELLSMGLNSDILPLPIEHPGKLLPLPKKFTVAVYAPTTPTAKHIYNLDFMADLIKSCPDISWVIYGGGLADVKGDNIEHLGWVDDIQKVIKKTSCLMRITAHDGLPIAPIEWRLAGRDAITTVQIKYIWYAGTGMIHEGNYADRKEKIINLLRVVKKEQKKFGVKHRKIARDYWLKITDPKAYKRRIRKIIRDYDKRLAN